MGSAVAMRCVVLKIVVSEQSDSHGGSADGSMSLPTRMLSISYPSNNVVFFASNYHVTPRYMIPVQRLPWCLCRDQQFCKIAAPQIER
jgi:hypothetical protein